MIATGALYGLIAIFAIGALVNLAGLKALRESFVDWGYPRWFNYVTGVLELATAAMLLTPSMVKMGVMLGAAIMLVALITLILNRAWRHLPGPILTLALAAIWCAAH